MRVELPPRFLFNEIFLRKTCKCTVMSFKGSAGHYPLMKTISQYIMFCKTTLKNNSLLQKKEKQQCNNDKPKGTSMIEEDSQ